MKKSYVRWSVMMTAGLMAMTVHAQSNDSISTDTTMWYNQMQQLDEVVVKSSLPKIRTNANGMKVIISGSELEKVGSSKDLLKRLPTVKSADDGVEIFGRGAAEVYVNGRKLYDSKELDQIPSDQILNVEIITNPGSRYAASTKAVVRIKTKRPQGEGWGFRDELKGFSNNGPGISNQADINYRQGGLDVSAMLTGSAQNIEMGAYETIEFYNNNQRTEQVIDKMNQKYKTRDFGTRLQVNYQINDNQSVGARYSFNRAPYMKFNINLPSDFYLNGDLFQRSMSHINKPMLSYAHFANMYYSGKIKQWQIDANLDGVWNDSKTWNNTDEMLTMVGHSPFLQQVNTFTHSDSRLYAGKLTFEHPLWGGSICFGTEYDATRRNEQNTNPVTSDGESKVDENIFALFTQYSRVLFQRLSAQVGLRYESVNSDFYEWGQHKMSRNYNDLFPSVGLSMPVGKVYLSANYGMDIARPAFGNLTNDIIYINSYSYQGGNPYLKPTYTQNLTLSASWKWLYAMANVSRVKDDIQIRNISYSDDQPMITLLHPDNLPSFNRYSLQAFASPTLFKIWHPTWGAVVLGQDYETQIADGSIIKMNHPLAQFMWNNLVDLPHGWRVGCDLMAMTTGDYSTYHLHRPCVTVDLSLYKSFFKNKLECRIKATDLTAVRAQPVTVYSYRNLYTKNDNHPYYELSLVYKFNVATDKYKGKGAGGKQKDRIQ